MGIFSAVLVIDESLVSPFTLQPFPIVQSLHLKLIFFIRFANQDRQKYHKMIATLYGWLKRALECLKTSSLVTNK